MKHFLRMAAAAVVAAGAMSAQAADFYAGGSAGASRWKIDDDPTFSIDKSDVGVKLFGGLQLHENFAVELGWAALGKAKFSGAGISGDVKGRGIFLDAVGMLPLSPQFHLLGRIGAFNGTAKGTVVGVGSTDDSGTDVKWGLGVGYALNKQTALRVEWERYRFDVFGDKGDVDLLSVGVAFKF
jgi:OOP family OmpA-OmpF porin